MIVFYDGDCPLCLRSINYLLRVDQDEVLRYASLNSAFAANFFGDQLEKVILHDSLIVVQGGNTYSRSQAFRKILERVAPRSLKLLLLRLTPGWISNAVYGLISKNRKAFFKECPLIPSDKKHLFIHYSRSIGIEKFNF